jgi:hypothetical protein
LSKALRAEEAKEQAKEEPEPATEEITECFQPI